MHYSYLHNIEERRVHKVPKTPNVSGDAKRGYHVSMSYSDIQASNRLLPTTRQWEHAVQPFREQFFDHPGHTRERAIEYFMLHHSPAGIAISEEEYLRLAAEYESEAQARR
jgi:hypothetical protein